MANCLRRLSSLWFCQPTILDQRPNGQRLTIWHGCEWNIAVMLQVVAHRRAKRAIPDLSLGIDVAEHALQGSQSHRKVDFALDQPCANAEHQADSKTGRRTSFDVGGWVVEECMPKAGCRIL